MSTAPPPTAQTSVAERLDALQPLGGHRGAAAHRRPSFTSARARPPPAAAGRAARRRWSRWAPAPATTLQRVPSRSAPALPSGDAGAGRPPRRRREASPPRLPRVTAPGASPPPASSTRAPGLHRPAGAACDEGRVERARRRVGTATKGLAVPLRDAARVAHRPGTLALSPAIAHQRREQGLAPRRRCQRSARSRPPPRGLGAAEDSAQPRCFPPAEACPRPRRRSSKWRRVPPSPTTQTSLAAKAKPALKVRVVGTITSAHAVPSKWSTAPPSPAAQTSAGPVPQSARRGGAGARGRAGKGDLDEARPGVLEQRSALAGPSHRGAVAPGGVEVGRGRGVDNSPRLVPTG